MGERGGGWVGRGCGGMERGLRGWEGGEGVEGLGGQGMWGDGVGVAGMGRE